MRAAAAALILGLWLFLGVSHGLHAAMPELDGTAPMGLMAICLVLFTVAAPLALVRASARFHLLHPARSAIAMPIPTVPTSSGVRARASPDWLQRFRN